MERYPGERRGSERKMARHAYRKHEGVVTVYEPRYRKRHTNNGTEMSPYVRLLAFLPFSLYVRSVKAVKARLTAARLADDRRFRHDGSALQRPENDPKLYRRGCRRVRRCCRSSPIVYRYSIIVLLRLRERKKKKRKKITFILCVPSRNT